MLLCAGDKTSVLDVKARLKQKKKTIWIVIVDFEINKKDSDFYSEYWILKKNAKG